MGIFFLISILFFLLTYTDLKFYFIEVQVPGECEVDLEKGAYTVYLMIDNPDDSTHQNYFFELKDLQNKIVKKFPDSLNPKWIYTTAIITIKDQEYISYSDFNINHEGKYLIKSYAKYSKIKPVVHLG